MTYIRAAKPQIDGLAALGNEGWDWDSLWPYYLKSEHFQPPTPEQADDGATYTPSAHGYSGPVYVGWMDMLLSGDVEGLIQAAWATLGFPQIADANTGNLRGFNVWPLTLNREQNIRWDAARGTSRPTLSCFHVCSNIPAAYYYPIAHRSNLQVYTNTLARRITWSDHPNYQHDQRLHASGVEIISSNGSLSHISANLEVILSAGSLISPILLEASGIGNPSILSTHSIPLRHPLPSVGENLQDQPNTNIAYLSSLNTTGYPPYATHATATDLFGPNLSTIESHIYTNIPAYAAAISAASHGALDTTAQQILLKQQADFIFRFHVPIAEILTPAMGSAILTAFWTLLPFSRGSVHIASLERNQAPTPDINPRFFQSDWDTQVQSAAARLARRALRSEPLANIAIEEVAPGLDTMPLDATDEEWMQYFRGSVGPNYHPVGTCAMMGRELGGVVDGEARVYGTGNVRVVDAGVLPFQIDGHLVGTLYAVGERVADLIRDGRGSGRGMGRGG